MSFLKPEKSPCLDCEDIGLDKNSAKCQNCVRRLEYCAMLDRENLVVDRYSYRISFGQKLTLKAKLHKQYKEAQVEIKSYGKLFCRFQGVHFHSVCDTTVRHPSVVRTRRMLLHKIRQKWDWVPNAQIGKALGIHPATVGVALRMPPPVELN